MFCQREKTRPSLAVLLSFDTKQNQQLDCIEGAESVRVSWDAQLHPWATTLGTDNLSLVYSSSFGTAISAPLLWPHISC